MANKWFRLYTKFATDADVQTLSESLQRRLVMLFCLRGMETHETLQPFQDRYIAFQLRISEQEWAGTKAEFIKRGFIDECNNIIKWDDRQYLTKSSTERVRRWREKQRNMINGNETGETLHETLQALHETPPDSDSETDLKKKKNLKKKEKK